MKKSKLLYHIRVLCFVSVVGFAAGCATPTQPTGGPPDRIPPQLLSVSPASGTVNFKGKKIEFEFSDFISRTSINQALQIEPDIGIGFEVRWNRKKVTIEFEDELPDSTTVIVTLGTQLADMQNNRIPAPITLALSTGAKIDEGVVTGRIINAATGKNESGQKVFLYRAPFDLSKPAAYISETDTSGAFTFSFISEGRYKAVFVEDRNRNRIWDISSERAQPFHEEEFFVMDAEEFKLKQIFVSSADTIKPRLVGVGMFSSQRLRLRFSEPVVLADSVNIQAVSGEDAVNVDPLYIDPRESFALFAQSQKPLTPEVEWELRVAGITDSAGNGLGVSALNFAGSSSSDTTLQRILGRKGNTGVLSNEPLEIWYAAPITRGAIIDSLTVIEGEIANEEWPRLGVDNNKLFVYPDLEWKQGANYQFLFWNPKTQRRISEEPEIWSPSDLGAVEITTNSEDSTVFRYKLKSTNGSIVREGNFSGNFVIDSLQPVSYSLTLYADLNNNQVWDLGTVQPHTPQEPYFIRLDIPVKNGFTTEIKPIF